MQSYSLTSKLLTSVTSEVIRGHKPEVTVNMTALSRGTGTWPEVTGYCHCGSLCYRKYAGSGRILLILTVEWPEVGQKLPESLLVLPEVAIDCPVHYWEANWGHFASHICRRPCRMYRGQLRSFVLQRSGADCERSEPRVGVWRAKRAAGGCGRAKRVAYGCVASEASGGGGRRQASHSRRRRRFASFSYLEVPLFMMFILRLSRSHMALFWCYGKQRRGGLLTPKKSMLGK